MLHYPEKDYYGEGVITRVLGDAGRPDVETQAVVLAYGLYEEFNEASKEEARRASTHFEESGDEDREDLTNTLIFTIDPPDARDFDDAINISYDDETKEWELGVHITDVASFSPKVRLTRGHLSEEIVCTYHGTLFQCCPKFCQTECVPCKRVFVAGQSRSLFALTEMARLLDIG